MPIWPSRRLCEYGLGPTMTMSAFDCDRQVIVNPSSLQGDHVIEG